MAEEVAGDGGDVALGPGIVAMTCHVTLGTLVGTRPKISRSKISTSWGRRWVHQIFAEVTVCRWRG